MDLSIIIISYNTLVLTQNCIQSIYASNLQLDYEIIVVDNASTDGSVEMIRTKFPDVQLIENNFNNMFGRANNQGAFIATGTYLLLLNSDTIVTTGQIERLCSSLDNSPLNVAVLGPKVLNSNGTLQSDGHPLPGLWSTVCDLFGPLLRFLPLKLRTNLLPVGHAKRGEIGMRQVGGISGSCMLIRSSIFKEVNGFDSDFDFSGEEIDLCNRLLQQGFETWVDPAASIVHFGGGSSSEDFQSTMVVRSLFLYHRKHFSRFHSILILFLRVCKDLIAGLISKGCEVRKRKWKNASRTIQVLRAICR